MKEEAIEKIRKNIDTLIDANLQICEVLRSLNHCIEHLDARLKKIEETIK